MLLCLWGYQELVPRSAGRMSTGSGRALGNAIHHQDIPLPVPPPSLATVHVGLCGVALGVRLYSTNRCRVISQRWLRMGGMNESHRRFFFPFLHAPHHCTVFPRRICISLWMLPREWTQLIPAVPCPGEPSLSTSVSPVPKRWWFFSLAFQQVSCARNSHNISSGHASPNLLKYDENQDSC